MSEAVTRLDEDDHLVVDHLHVAGTWRRALPEGLREAVLALGDGLGSPSREDLAARNEGERWTHVRDSSPAAWRAMAARLRAAGWAGRPGDPGTPLFVDVEGRTATRPGVGIVERDAVLAIVEHWAEDLTLGPRWPGVGWETLVTGGVEPGQGPFEAAAAEVAEETGYRSPGLLATLPPVEARFFHEAKGVNRHARFAVLALRLRDGSRDPVAAHEAALHEPVWLTPGAMASFALPPAQRHAWKAWRRLRG